MAEDDSLLRRVAGAVQDLYRKLPANGKPSGEVEFTVLSGMVAIVSGGTDIRVLSLATGTKCVGPQSMAVGDAGGIVSDSHAEVLARRGFIRYLSKSLVAHLQGQESWLLKQDGTGGKMRIKENVRIYLYISDNPCGDACIYHQQQGAKLSFTGAKPVAAWSREDSQSLGAVRTKSGRSDLPAEQRTTSMSCSDKICRWAHLGLQGSLLSAFLEPVALAGIVIDPDPAAEIGAQLEALRRAVVARCPVEGGSSSSTDALQLCVAPSSKGHTFAAGKCCMERKLAAAPEEGKPLKARPVGTSINWVRDVATAASSSGGGDIIERLRKRHNAVAGGTVEVTLAHTGALQGAVKRLAGVAESCSRLCKRETGRLLGLVLREEGLYRACSLEPLRATLSVQAVGDDGNGALMAAALSRTYQWWKEADREYTQRRASFLGTKPFHEWIVDGAPYFVIGEEPEQDPRGEEDQARKKPCPECVE